MNTSARKRKKSKTFLNVNIHPYDGKYTPLVSKTARNPYTHTDRITVLGRDIRPFPVFIAEVRKRLHSESRQN